MGSEAAPGSSRRMCSSPSCKKKSAVKRIKQGSTSGERILFDNVVRLSYSIHVSLKLKESGPVKAGHSPPESSWHETWH
jgi:hypothetical protein